MSIERNRSSESIDAARRREQAERPTGDQRQPPAPERIDRFRAVLDQAREGETGEQDLQMQARAQARAAQAQLSDQAAGDDIARANALSERAGDSARKRADDLGLSASSLQSADASALFHAQMALREGAAPAQTQPPATNPQALADLIERHVRQLAVGDAAARSSDGAVLLRMSDATLPGTDLLLTRTADGWSLRADVRSRSSFDAIREAAPELTKRFAERNLGTLSIDPHLHS